MWMLLVTSWWDQVTKWLTVEPQGVLGLMLAHWWAESGRIQKTLRQLSAHWWVKPGLGISAGLLVGRAGSYSLVVGPKGPRYDVRLLEGVSSS